MSGKGTITQEDGTMAITVIMLVPMVTGQKIKTQESAENGTWYYYEGKEERVKRMAGNYYL